jgi:phage terminase large subunit GpA-like protein
MLDQWAEEERYLSEDESNAGNTRWRWEMVPPAQEIARAYSDAPDQVLWTIDNESPSYRGEGSIYSPRAVPWTKYNELLCWMSSAQQGKTQLICNIVGHHMTDDPRQILVILPDQHLRRTFSLKKLGTMLRDTPCLQGLIRDNKARDSENTIESKAFPGGGISILISSSGNNLRSWSGSVGICDEFDAWVFSANKQGDPYSLLLDRLQTFSRRKVFVASTPLAKESSRIEPMYEKGTKEQWFYPCPSCGGYQLVSFDDRFVRPEKVNGSYPDDALFSYTCQYCGCLQAEADWKAGEARWIARNPAAEYRSFHTSAMTSLLTTWRAIQQRFELAMDALNNGDPEKYKAFVNAVRGETYEEKGETLPDNHFTRLDNPQRHWYHADVPSGVKVLTLAVDTQDDRCEFEIRGWGAGQETWGIQYGVIYGHPDDAELIATIDGLRSKFYQREDGAWLTISRTVWDAMGHYPDQVYAYTREREPDVFAIRGGSEWHAPVIGRMGKVDKQGIITPIFAIGTIAAKDALYNRLKVAHAGKGFCHWPMDPTLGDDITPRLYDEGYFAMLVSEKRVQRIARGVRYNAWVPKRSGIRNEAWDLLVYNLAALMIYLGPRSIDDLPKPEKGAPVSSSAPAGRRILSRGVRV